MSSPQQGLKAALRHWRLAALLPYLWLSTGFTTLGAWGYFSLGWPRWLLPGWLGIVALAMRLERNWRLSLTNLGRRLDRQFPQPQDSSQLLSQVGSD